MPTKAKHFRRRRPHSIYLLDRHSAVLRSIADERSMSLSQTVETLLLPFLERQPEYLDQIK